MILPTCIFIVENSMSVFNSLAVMLSMPGAFPLFNFLTASFTSPSVGSVSAISSIASWKSISSSSSSMMVIGFCGGSQRRQTTSVIDKHGNLLANKKDIQDRWTEHFKDCYLIPVKNKNSSFIPEQRKKRLNNFSEICIHLK